MEPNTNGDHIKNLLKEDNTIAENYIEKSCDFDKNAPQKSSDTGIKCKKESPYKVVKKTEADSIYVDKDSFLKEYLKDSKLLEMTWGTWKHKDDGKFKCKCYEKCRDLSKYTDTSKYMTINKEILFRDEKGNIRRSRAFNIIEFDNLKEYVESFPQKHRLFHETISYDRLCKLAIDFDCDKQDLEFYFKNNNIELKNSDKPREPEAYRIVGAIVKYIIEYIEGNYGLGINLSNIEEIRKCANVYKSNTPRKYSYHVVFCFGVTNSRYASYIIKHLLGELIESEKHPFIRDGVQKFVDPGVYSNRCNLRLLGCVKEGKDNPKYLYKPNNEELDYRDSLVTYPYFRGNELIDITDYIKSEYEESQQLSTKRNANFHITVDVEKDQLDAQILVNLLSDERAEEYNDWIYVGMTIRNIFGDDDKKIGINLFHSFSAKSSLYDENLCYMKWETFSTNLPKGKGRNIGSLHMWAKQDNEEQYLLEFPPKKISIAPTKKNHVSSVADDAIYNSNITVFNSHDEGEFLGQFNNINDVYDIAIDRYRNFIAIIKNSGDSSIFIKHQPNKGEYDYNIDKLSRIKEPLPYNFEISNDSKNEYGSISVKQILSQMITRKVNTFERIEFRPFNKKNESFDKEAFNLFNGFKVDWINREIVDKECKEKYGCDISSLSIEPILYHFKKILSNNNDEIYEYLINWFSTFFQNPTEKLPAIILYSQSEGSGKSRFIELISSELIGRRYTRFADLSRITGKFNSLLMNNLLFVINEMRAFDTGHTKIDDLKTLITDPPKEVEKKFMDSFTVDNHSKFIITTNNKNVVPILSEKERRFMFVELSNNKALDKEYFDNLYDKSMTKYHLIKFYDMLMEIDLSKFDKNKIPMTQIKRDIIADSRPLYERFLIDLYHDDFPNTITFPNSDEEYITITTNNLFIAFESWMSYHRITVKTTRDYFSKGISKKYEIIRAYVTDEFGIKKRTRCIKISRESIQKYFNLEVEKCDYPEEALG